VGLLSVRVALFKEVKDVRRQEAETPLEAVLAVFTVLTMECFPYLLCFSVEVSICACSLSNALAKVASI
jgi:hypothetical protein